MDFTPRHNKDVFVTRKEGETVARTFWVLFIQISVCGEEEGRVEGGENGLLPTLGLTSGVDALGRPGAAPNSLSFTHWFIPQTVAERLQRARHSGKHFTGIISCDFCPQPNKKDNTINPILQMRKLRPNETKPGPKVTQLMNNTEAQRRGN